MIVFARDCASAVRSMSHSMSVILNDRVRVTPSRRIRPVRGRCSDLGFGLVTGSPVRVVDSVVQGSGINNFGVSERRRQ